MLAITDYPAFVIAILVFLAIPGPGNLAMISSTAQGGIRGGLASTFGIIAGDQILLWCAVAGVAALLKAYPAAFATVQWVGAAYLAWMGYKLITAKPGQGAVLQLKPSHFARQSFFITLLNTFVGAWNSWYNASIYVPADKTKWPIQLFINEMTSANVNFLETATPNYSRYLIQFAVIVVATLPIMVAMPFFQDKIEAGQLQGGVKG